MKIKGGKMTFSGDGATTTFYIPHHLGEVPTVALVGKAVENLPDIDYWEADVSNIKVHFKTAPAHGTDNVILWWLAIKL